MSKTERKMCVFGRWAQRKDKTQPKQKKKRRISIETIHKQNNKRNNIGKKKKKNKVTANKIHRITFLNKQ